MPELDSARIAYMAKRESDQFDKTATIQYPSIANSAQGPVTTWTNRATGVLCALFDTPRVPREAAEADSVKVVAQFQVNLPENQAVAVTDRILIDGRTFQVEEVPALSLQTVVVCLCSEVK